MDTGNPVIVLELNELTPRLMRRFMSEGHLPNFSQLFSESYAYLTDAGEDPPWLEPWIQWVTVHTGVAAKDHGIFNLGDSVKSKRPSLWDIVSDNGYPVWVCGSMNASYRPGVKGEILPDPWSVHVQPTPENLRPYFEFVRGQVLEYTRPTSKLGTEEALRFGAFMVANGLSSATVSAVALQLISEKLSAVRWRRATILDRMQYDLFESRFRRIRPRLATFFLNSTAHFQHVYWRNLEPELFTAQPSKKEQRAYGNAVLYGYQQMDRIVGRALALASDNNAVLVFVSALSQQPCLKYEGKGGKRYYRPVNYLRVLDAVGIDATSCEPEAVMSEQFHLRFGNAEAAASATTKLQNATVEGQPAFTTRLDGNSILTGCAVFEEMPPDSIFSAGSFKAPFNSLFYMVDLKKSGMHHRDGMAWFRLPGKGHSDGQERVSLIDVAPTILAALGMEQPDYMPGHVLDIPEITQRVSHRSRDVRSASLSAR